MIQIFSSILYYLNVAALLQSQYQNVSDSHPATTTPNGREELGDAISPLLVKQIPPGPIVPGVIVKFVCSADATLGNDDCNNQEKLSYQWEMYRYTEDNGNLTSSSVVKLSGQDAEMEMEFNESVANPKMHCDLICTVNNNAKPSTGSIKLEFRNNENEGMRLGPPTNFKLLSITSRNAYFTWDAPITNRTDEISTNQGYNVTSYIIEYRNGRGMSDWKNGRVSRYEIRDGSARVACISNLSPWSTYHFRIFAVSNNISSPSSLPISSILTLEDIPSAAPLNVKVVAMQDNILQVSWKPPPRASWNGALLGYNVGFKKASTSEDDQYEIHMFSPSETLGNPYFDQITVPDVSVKYDVVVQAFNNIGAGPFSHPVSQS